MNITGQAWHSVGIDEAHEMLVNRDCKSAVVHPNKEFISRMALYFPYRSKLMQNFKKQVNPSSTQGNNQKKTQIIKARENIEAMKEMLKKSETLSLQTTELRNGFTDTNSTPAQQSDLINFRKIGQNDFDAYVEHVYLRTGNTRAQVK